MARAAGTLHSLLLPFWLSYTMHSESVMLVARDERIDAGLLFPPDRVLAAKSADGSIDYVEGADYRVDHGAGRIVLVPGSRMPHRTREAISDGTLTDDRTVAVTYTHSVDLTPWQPPESPGEIPRVMRRLQRREPLTICLTGDSISEGYDASGFHGRPPFQPGYGDLVKTALEQEYGTQVHLRNLATAGSTAADALWITSPIAAGAPDLVIVAFGMNDASYAEASEFSENVATLLRRVRAEAPDVEFLLVSPMLPTPECGWVVASRFREYQAALAELTGEGVILADVTGLWTRVVERKEPHDLSGNGLNHPNDFGHRLYVHAIVGQLGVGRAQRPRS